MNKKEIIKELNRELYQLEKQLLYNHNNFRNYDLQINVAIRNKIDALIAFKTAIGE